MYKQFIRPYLFCFKPETSHRLYLALVRISAHFPGRYAVRLFHKYDAPGLKREVFGLEFRNPVGLAAGFDFNGDHFNELSDFGFGFLEIGQPLFGAVQREIVNPKVMGVWLGTTKLTNAIFSAIMAIVAGYVYDNLGPVWMFAIWLACEVLIRMPLFSSIPETLGN